MVRMLDPILWCQNHLPVFTPDQLANTPLTVEQQQQVLQQAIILPGSQKKYGFADLLQAEKSLWQHLKKLASNNQRPEKELSSYTLDIMQRVLRETREPAAVLAEREQVLRQLVAAPAPLQWLTGPPGTGKSTTARAIVRLFSELGAHVQAFAASPTAQARLQQKIQMPVGSVPDCFDMPAHSVVLVDEAGFLDTYAMKELLAHAVDKQWSRLVLMGDWQQETPAGPGQPLKLLQKHFDHVTMTIGIIQRQRTAQQQNMVWSLYHGQAQQALHALDKATGIIFSDMAHAGEHVQQWLANVMSDTQREGLLLNVGSKTNPQPPQFMHNISLPNSVQQHAIAAAQGLATDHSLVVIDQPISGRDLLTACSRHRYSVTLLVDKALYSDIQSLSAAGSIFPTKPMMIDVLGIGGFTNN